jgi:SAM-dependent methyltransferase
LQEQLEDREDESTHSAGGDGRGLEFRHASIVQIPALVLRRAVGFRATHPNHVMIPRDGTCRSFGGQHRRRAPFHRVVTELKRGVRAFRRALSAAVIDRLLNVDTAERVALAELALDAADRVDYEPGGWRDLRRVLRPTEIRPGEVFLDLGSGKGRIVLSAARFPFRRIIGVELSERLTAIARRNVATCRLRPRDVDIELVTADVLAYRIPDEVSVVYMFNPFGGAIFESVIAKLIASVDRRPRAVRVILRNVGHDRLTQTGRFRLMRTSLGLRPGREWREATAIRLYVLEPRGSPPGAQT